MEGANKKNRKGFGEFAILFLTDYYEYVIISLYPDFDN